MRPVIVQNLIKKMRDRVNILPEPVSITQEGPIRRDRTTSILVAAVVIAIVLVMVL